MASAERKPPWYAERDRWMAEAFRYRHAIAHLPPDAPHHAELRAFDQLCSMRLVFESNLIEGAGLSEGDTRKIIQEQFPEVPSTHDAFRTADALTYLGDSIAKIESVVSASGKAGLFPSYRFKGKSRPTREVLQHYLAYFMAEVVALRYWFATRHPEVPPRPSFVTHAKDQLRFAEVLPRLNQQPPRLITEAAIKFLHATIAENLLPDDAAVEAGQYRVDARSVGLDIGFPAHELVPAAMKAFEQRSHETMISGLDPVSKAARITYDFLMIHPFPDFNGRISRLLLAMILFAEGVPFAVTLRGDKHWKRRYLFALRRANRDDLRPYETLIARLMVESFQEIDRNIAAAGLPGLLTFTLQSAT